MKKSIKCLVIILSYLIIVIGLAINFSRKSPTIPSIPQFVYIEHIIGPFAIGIIIFSICLSIWVFADILNIFKKKYNKKCRDFLCGLLGGSGSITISVYYELFSQAGKTIYQLPFDIIGIVGYLLYLDYAYNLNYVFKSRK